MRGEGLATAQRTQGYCSPMIPERWNLKGCPLCLALSHPLTVASEVPSAIPRGQTLSELTSTRLVSVVGKTHLLFSVYPVGFDIL